MNKSMFAIACVSVSALACASSLPPPTQHLADAQSAERSAAELGAANDPGAQLHLQLAREQTAQASLAMQNGDNDRADSLLARAQSDAELAIALTREQNAKTLNTKSTADSNAQQVTNANQGAVK